MSVEDAYGCKRSLSVPGIAVNVRRVLVSRLVALIPRELIDELRSIADSQVLRQAQPTAGDGPRSRAGNIAVASYGRRGK